MALLTDKYTTETLENRLNEFSEYGMTLYYLFEEGRTNIDDLSNLFFSKDEEKTIFTYGKIMKRMKPVDLEESFNKYKENYPNNSKKDLNIIFTKKIIDLVLEKNNTIDKTYINTYNYLLTNQK
jgi:hypothetical protein